MSKPRKLASLEACPHRCGKGPFTVRGWYTHLCRSHPGSPHYPYTPENTLWKEMTTPVQAKLMKTFADRDAYDRWRKSGGPERRDEQIVLARERLHRPFEVAEMERRQAALGSSGICPLAWHLYSEVC